MQLQPTKFDAHTQTQIPVDAEFEELARQVEAGWQKRFNQPEQALAIVSPIIPKLRRWPELFYNARITQAGCYIIAEENLETAENQLIEALRFSEMKGMVELQLRALSDLSMFNTCLGDDGKATFYIEWGRGLAVKEQQDEWLVRFHRLQGENNSRFGRYTDALEHLLNAINLFGALEEGQVDAFFHTDHQHELLLAYKAIGVVYSNLSEYAKAIEYYQIALEGFRRYRLTLASRVLYNMGIAWEESKKYVKAHRCYQESVKIARQTGEANIVASSLRGMGGVLYAQKEYQAAILVLEEARDALKNNLVDQSFYADALWTLAQVYRATEQYSKAIPCLQEALTLFEVTHRPEEQFSELHRQLYRTYKEMGDFAKALHHHEESWRLHEIHNKQVINAQMREMMVRFDTEQAIKERESYQVRSEELEREIAERKVAEKALARAKKELEIRNQEMQRLLTRDHLTGLYNRRYVEDQLAAAVKDAAQQPVTVMICDLDNFKLINDTFSHAIGDAVLCQVALLMQAVCRKEDTVARYGGEEFVALYPQTTLAEALVQVERLRQRVADFDWGMIQSGLTVTFSAGLAKYNHHADHEKLLHSADEQLYLAKRSGKNRICATCEPWEQE